MTSATRTPTPAATPAVPARRECWTVPFTDAGQWPAPGRGGRLDDDPPSARFYPDDHEPCCDHRWAFEYGDAFAGHCPDCYDTRHQHEPEWGPQSRAMLARENRP